MAEDGIVVDLDFKWAVEILSRAAKQIANST